jgi:hypothetical protein
MEGHAIGDVFDGSSSFAASFDDEILHVSRAVGIADRRYSKREGSRLIFLHISLSIRESPSFLYSGTFTHALSSTTCI